MPRILISGYYGFNNAGDDVVLYGIISSLRREQPNISLSVLSNTPERTAALFGIPAFNRWRISTIVRELKRCDLLVMGGGTLMQDVTSPRSVLYYLGIVMIAKLLGKPVVFYAQGFGPILKTFSKWLIKRVVNLVDVITVRDFESGEDFKACGVTAPIYVTADPALTIHRDEIPVEPGAQMVAELFTDRSRPLAVFSVRNWKQEERFKHSIAQAADSFIRQGWNVLFLPMHYPSDIPPSHEIVSYMKEPGAQVLDRSVTFHDIMSILKQSQYVVGMRLHSLILSCMLQVPFTGISYDPKIDRFVERAGMPCAGHIKELDAAGLLQLLAERTSDLNRERGIIAETSRTLASEAAKSSELVLQALQRSAK